MVINSSWWQYDRRRAFTIVSRQQDQFTAFHEAFPDRTFMLDYTDVINYTTRLEVKWFPCYGWLLLSISINVCVFSYNLLRQNRGCSSSWECPTSASGSRK